MRLWATEARQASSIRLHKTNTEVWMLCGRGKTNASSDLIRFEVLDFCGLTGWILLYEESP